MINNFHNRHPRLGHYLFIFGAFLLLVSFTLLAPYSAKSKAFGTSDILILTNEARAQFSKKPFKSNFRLMNAAQMKAEDMAKLRYFAHTAPDGTLAWDYFKKVSYIYEIAGENLAITNETAKEVIDGWLNSPTHRDNLLSEDFKDIGIGLAYFGEYQNHKNTYVIVALYGNSTSVQSISATTSPAGASIFFKPDITNFPPAFIALIAGAAMVAGSLIELLRIKKIHQSVSI